MFYSHPAYCPSMLKEYTWRKTRAAKLEKKKKTLIEQRKKQKTSEQDANADPFLSPEQHGVTVLSQIQLDPDDVGQCGTFTG